ncbi:ankyrin repeat-containing domain protein [Camillea tinctor]|nr:ankyrin repeat-containing domain protein [Camillea tinctor]
MNLFDFPPEIVPHIMKHIILSRRFMRTMRIRVVSRTFFSFPTSTRPSSVSAVYLRHPSAYAKNPPCNRVCSDVFGTNPEAALRIGDLALINVPPDASGGDYVRELLRAVRTYRALVDVALSSPEQDGMLIYYVHCVLWPDAWVRVMGSARMSSRPLLSCLAESVAQGQYGHGAPLLEAVWRRDEEITRILLDAGADPNINWLPSTPLVIAVWSCRTSLVKMLLDHGADVNVGHPPPIVVAVVREDLRMFRLLREHGARLDMPETGGWAMALARLRGLSSMVDLLVSEGVGKTWSYTASHGGMSRTGGMDISCLCEHTNHSRMGNLIWSSREGLSYTHIF